MRRSSRLTAVLFDKDGTLIDFTKTWGPWAKITIDGFAERHGLCKDELSTSLGFDRDTEVFAPQSPMIAGSAEEIVAHMKAAYPDLTAHALDDLRSPEVPKLAPVPVTDLVALLERIAAMGISIGLVTNDSEQGARVHLQALGIEDCFGTVIGFDSGYGGKPAPDGCLAAARALGVAPENCVLVGDSLHDLTAARSAGMWAAAVPNGITLPGSLVGHADVMLDDLDQLIDWLSEATSD